MAKEEKTSEEHNCTAVLKNKKKVRVEFIQENFAALHNTKAKAVTDHIYERISRATRQCAVRIASTIEWTIGVKFQNPLFVRKISCYGAHSPIFNTKDGIPYHAIYLDPVLMAKECKTAEKLQHHCAETLAHEWGHARLTMTGTKPKKGWFSPLGAFHTLAYLSGIGFVAGMTATLLAAFLIGSPTLTAMLLLGVVASYGLFCVSLMLPIFILDEEAIVRRYASNELKGPDKDKWLAIFRVIEVIDYQI